MPDVRPSGAWTLVRVIPFVMILSGVLPACASEREEQIRACKDDVFRLCFLDIPNEKLMSACLESKRERLSPRCRAQFEDDPPSATRSGQSGMPPASAAPATEH
ncbi:hypothetical protein D3W54_05375 [Komagataeibacter medellinensis]|nr:hypothetical protein [Komagataeibacter medellinensis]KAB8123733.1 hypothetical protein D3W54_05375 [Komagataeibacter medellinensis]